MNDKFDFSRHVLTHTDLGKVQIYDFCIPGTRTYAFHFVLARGCTFVAGDYGNWVFCRPFSPIRDEMVNIDYFAEKARINSEQVVERFSEEKTREYIRERIKIMKESEEKTEELEELLTSPFSCEHEYVELFMGLSDDYDEIIIGHEYDYSFVAVWAAFNEMINRVKNQQITEVKVV